MTKLPRLPLTAVLPPPPSAGVAGDPGVCVPGGQFQRVSAERAVVLGGPAAILLQVAHPLVAEGVAVHSDYTSGPAHRLLGTLQAALTIAFGDTRQAHDIARHVGAQHARVRGTTRTDAPGTPAGTPYRANDPDLALWVHATLVWTARRVAERYVGLTLSPEDRERHWQESKPFARLFAVPDRVLPAGVEEFDDYFERTVSGLVVTESARRVAGDILTQRTSPPLPGVAALARSITVDVLPTRLARAYGVEPPLGRRAAAGVVAAGLRAVRPVLPQRIAEWPHAAVARRRVQVLQPRASTGHGSQPATTN